MEALILLIIGIFISSILILLGIILIYYNYNFYEKTIGIIEEAKCALDRKKKNFIYNCEIKLYYNIKNKKYINFKNVKTTLVPYRKYDKINIFYNKNNPIEIIIDENINNYYTYIPLIIGIILFILTITIYLFYRF